ncbi:histone H3-lysine(4) N-trimethyltransferase ATX1-like [Mangifera indica]|uniref:histone H3-lysine(4) N-trimethyltransferase ATX1-like n=1 Tax=Mangifera indica TaxID=29780 RepID=UPI001CF9300B|nr:histone H3-lysine(4) N-trimethyltransferase ATX1-like [Mangifera indica]XP_044474895.1 histone H3-lysine(4) N-trimethyltransferase ATX1-like [Mangifera indica]XP_044474896.1 histone H3-lysine(4) N-trimethyltransferase ATX1-like [Mangifera indica]
MSGKQVVGDPSHDDGGGGKKAAAMKLEREVKLGDIIWVKLQGKSWWPAQVVDEKTVSESNKPYNKAVGAALVRLYGTYEYLYVDIIKSHLEFKMVLEQNNGSYLEIFEKALEQECSRKKSGRSKEKQSKSTGNVVKPNSSSAGYDTKGRSPQKDEVLKKQKLESPNSGTDVLRKSHELSARRLRVMQSLGLIAPSGSPFGKNGQISVSL